MRTGHTARQIAAPADPEHVFPYKEVHLGVLLTLHHLGGFRGKPTHNFWGPR